MTELDACAHRVAEGTFAVFIFDMESEWRYYTHWANCVMNEEAVRWFEVAAERLEEITEDRTQ